MDPDRLLHRDRHGRANRRGGHGCAGRERDACSDRRLPGQRGRALGPRLRAAARAPCRLRTRLHQQALLELDHERALARDPVVRRGLRRPDGADRADAPQPQRHDAGRRPRRLQPALSPARAAARRGRPGQRDPADRPGVQRRLVSLDDRRAARKRTLQGLLAPDRRRRCAACRARTSGSTGRPTAAAHTSDGGKRRLRAASAYPGDSYVDYIGLDVFDQSWAPQSDRASVRWREFVNGRPTAWPGTPASRRSTRSR